MKEENRKRYLASLTDDYVKRRIDRRTFVSWAARLGLSVGALGLGSRYLAPRAYAADAPGKVNWQGNLMDWCKDVGKPLKGQTIKFATESTPPSNVINSLLKPSFEEATGIKVEIEVLPLEQVLQKMTLDVASGLGTYDCYYIDQSWMASFSRDVLDPRETYQKNKALALPDYDFDDFLKPLMDGISMYNGVMVGVPYDIPIFIQMYRRDLYDELKLKPATTMDQYLQNAKAISEAKGPKMFGTTGQMKSGHYSLECDWTCWLWAHGGSIFNPNKKFSGNDDRGVAALEYWKKLKQYMPQAVTEWTWDGEAQSVTQGLVGSIISWGEFFPSWDNPTGSQVSGLMEAAVPPAPIALRTVNQTGFGEIPGVGHQGGSSIAVSKYSKHPEAAWVFMQWATAKETQVQIVTLGGGTGPTRASAFADPRVKANAKPGIVGTTRHLDVVRTTIEKYMGSEPDLPPWTEISNDLIPVELGKYWASGGTSPKATLDAIAQKVDALVAKG